MGDFCHFAQTDQSRSLIPESHDAVHGADEKFAASVTAPRAFYRTASPQTYNRNLHVAMHRLHDVRTSKIWYLNREQRADTVELCVLARVSASLLLLLLSSNFDSAAYAKVFDPDKNPSIHGRHEIDYCHIRCLKDAIKDKY
jgi:hypothetical protein